MALKIVSGLDATSISLSSFLDLAKNELRNAQIQNLSTTQINAISGPVQGQFVYDSTLDKLKVYDGEAWTLVGAAADETTITLSSNTLTIKDGGVSAAKLASSAVTSAKIATGAVTNAKLGADAVTGAKIADDSIDSEHYVDGSIDTAHIADDAITHDKLSARFTGYTTISTLTGTVSFDCSTTSCFKMSGTLTGALTIDLTGYKKGQVITIYNLYGQSLTLDAQGSSTNTFNKIGGVDYDNTSYSILQIEVADDSSTDPVFFYSIGTYASDSTP